MKQFVNPASYLLAPLDAWYYMHQRESMETIGIELFDLLYQKSSVRKFCELISSKNPTHLHGGISQFIPQPAVENQLVEKGQIWLTRDYCVSLIDPDIVFLRRNKEFSINGYEPLFVYINSVPISLGQQSIVEAMPLEKNISSLQSHLCYALVPDCPPCLQNYQYVFTERKIQVCTNHLLKCMGQFNQLLAPPFELTAQRIALLKAMRENKDVVLDEEMFFLLNQDITPEREHPEIQDQMIKILLGIDERDWDRFGYIEQQLTHLQVGYDNLLKYASFLNPLKKVA